MFEENLRCLKKKFKENQRCSKKMYGKNCFKGAIRVLYLNVEVIRCFFMLMSKQAAENII